MFFRSSRAHSRVVSTGGSQGGSSGKDGYLLPRVKDTLDALGRAQALDAIWVM